MSCFEPFLDFEADAAQREAFAALLDDDNEENLARRWEYFLEQDPERATSGLGFVPLIAEHGYTTVAVPAANGVELAYSVGFFYSYGFPELMVESKGLTHSELEDLFAALAEEVEDLVDEEDDEADEPPMSTRFRQLCELAVPIFKAAGLAVDRFQTPTPEFLEANAYGFGWSFYVHFMDTHDVPLLRTRVMRAR